MTDNNLIISKLLNPVKLWTREDILQRPAQVPATNGIYAWYFNTTPNIEVFKNYFNIDKTTSFLQDSYKIKDYQLLYIGISPKDENSKNNIRQRLRGHMNGNAYGSTLRLSLGCLLSDELNIRLQQHGKSIHFGDGEKRLSEWISNNAIVTFQVCDKPWEAEDEAIETLILPLNLRDNKHSLFKIPLENIRKNAKKAARL